MNYKTYIKSQQWKEKRKIKLETCKSKCECEGGCVREATQVHHLHYDTLGDESMEDLQALCSKCHMAKSPKVRTFYGGSVRNCCLLEDHQEVEKILPYSVWHEANFHYQMTPEDPEEAKWNSAPRTKSEYHEIAEKLETIPVIVALLDNLDFMFACGDIGVEDKVTQAIGKYVDIVYDDYFGGDIYKIKPEFEQFFEYKIKRDFE